MNALLMSCFIMGCVFMAALILPKSTVKETPKQDFLPETHGRIEPMYMPKGLIDSDSFLQFIDRLRDDDEEGTSV